MDETSTRRAARKLLSAEVIVALVLGFLSIGSFVLQVLTFGVQTSRLEVALFNTLQLLLTVSFGWFSTRALSRAEFEASLKRFAVSAYRRAADINEMMRRLKSRLAVLRDSRQRNGEQSADLDVVAAVIDDSLQVAESSIADWADVIGQEMLALEAVRRLEAQKQQLRQEPADLGNEVIAGRVEDIEK